MIYILEVDLEVKPTLPKTNSKFAPEFSMVGSDDSFPFVGFGPIFLEGPNSLLVSGRANITI